MVALTKENIKGLLDELKDRYGNLKISEIEKKIWEDKNLQGISIHHKLLFGKRIKVRQKNDGLLEKYTIFGSKRL